MSRRSAVLSVLWLARVLAAQTPDTATVHGQVSDPSHAAVAGVEIVMKNTQTGLERKAQTDDTGRFSIEGLPIAGAYDVAARKPGFADADLKHVTLQGGATADLNIQLSLASGTS